jgi:hypothetical protein
VRACRNTCKPLHNSLTTRVPLAGRLAHINFWPEKPTFRNARDLTPARGAAAEGQRDRSV